MHVLYCPGAQQRGHVAAVYPSSRRCLKRICAAVGDARMVQSETSITVLYFVINLHEYTIFLTIPAYQKRNSYQKIILEMRRGHVAKRTRCAAFDCTSRPVESWTAANRATGGRTHQCRWPPGRGFCPWIGLLQLCPGHEQFCLGAMRCEDRLGDQTRLKVDKG